MISLMNALSEPDGRPSLKYTTDKSLHLIIDSWHCLFRPTSKAAYTGPWTVTASSDAVIAIAEMAFHRRV